MSLRSGLLIALSTTLLGSTAASAGPVTVTSYEMNNGNGNGFARHLQLLGRGVRRNYDQP